MLVNNFMEINVKALLFIYSTTELNTPKGG